MPGTFPVKHRRRRAGPPPGKPAAYRQLWRIVDGAVRDTFEQHPEYLTPAGRRQAQRSVVKRVTGQVLGYAVQTAQARSAASAARDTAGESNCSPAELGVGFRPAGRRVREAPAGHLFRCLVGWWRRR